MSQTEISGQLLDGLPRSMVQTFMLFVNFGDFLSLHLAPSSGENLNLSSTLVYLADSLFFFS